MFLMRVFENDSQVVYARVRAIWIASGVYYLLSGLAVNPSWRLGHPFHAD